MDAVIFDVDGTLCDVRTVRHLVNGPERDFYRFHVESTGCPPVRETLGLWNSIDPSVEKIIVTARQRQFYTHTLWWLLLNGIEPGYIFMRDNNDTRPDFDVKRDILRRIQTRYTVKFAIDDNPAVIALWAQESIPFLVIPGWEG